jgi:hypothetical protein
MSTPLQPINYMQQRDLTPSEWWELYKKTKMDGEASVRECELEIKDLTIRAQKAERERDEANAQMCQAIGHLSDIAQTCQDWLDSIIQEPAVDFIKAIRDWAKRKVEGK